MIRKLRPPVRSVERRAAAALAAGAALLAAVPAQAAPTCLDAAGETVRCEAPHALPVGASPATVAEDAQRQPIPLPPPETLFGVICLLGGLFALIALMPDFDGWSPDDQERRGEGD